MDRETREQLIAQYRDGYRAVSEVLLKITPEEVDSRPAPGKWSVREIVHHLADSEMIAAVRLRLILTFDRPAIERRDQDEMARRLHYDRPYETSLELFKVVRESTAELLDRMTEADWTRAAAHAQAGTFTAERWLEIYAPHAAKHARQIRVARSAAIKAESNQSS